MKSSSRTSLVFASIFTVIFLSTFLLTRATTTPAEDFLVTFEEKPSLDRVCFYITLKNNQDSSDNFPFKLCYYFNEIPVNPQTGKPGSYGHMKVVAE